MTVVGNRYLRIKNNEIRHVSSDYCEPGEEKRKLNNKHCRPIFALCSCLVCLCIDYRIGLLHSAFSPSGAGIRVITLGVNAT